MTRVTYTRNAFFRAHAKDDQLQAHDCAIA